MKKISIAVAMGAVLAGCASVAADPDYAKAALDMMKADFSSKGPATLERMVNQDEVQRICSANPAGLAAPAAAALERDQLATVKLPADGVYLGDWKRGEAIAQNGRGMQSSDAVGAPNGGNCYACHQLSKSEVSFGNIGPSLHNYGKLRGRDAAVLKYTWGKLYNSNAYKACSTMPRFGHNGILDEKQLKDLMALLLDPASPVNK